MEWRDDGERRWLEAELPGARAAFTTRVGGVSEAPFDTLNVAILNGDRVDDVRENRRRVASSLDHPPEMVLIGRQVHGAAVAEHDRPQDPSPFAEPGPKPAEVDGHVARSEGLVPLVMVADCLPVALSGPGGVAILHCGWRGMAAGIVEAGAGAIDASAAAVGPGIGRCCYEVGDEVLDAFSELGEGIADGRMLDLTEVARRLLARAGVGHVDASELCTSCNPELLFSHRRDGARTGRQAGLVWITGDPAGADAKRSIRAE